MVSIIKNQLLKHLSRFTKNLSADKINLNTFKGEGELSNLELNEIVLTELLELPSWLRLTKAWCNKVTFRIAWTKLKSVPIYLCLDEVNITVETCEELRQMSSQTGLSSYAVPGKYSLVHKIIDGITVTVNTVNILFNSPAFTASVQISRIVVESKSPRWSKADLRMTRIKDPEKGHLLIFKELEWQTVRIEAKSTIDKNLTPLRLLTNQARCRIVIKKRLSDCFVLGSRLVIILDDLLWVLTDSQLKAALHFLDSLAGLVKKATEVTRSAKAARKLQELPANSFLGGDGKGADKAANLAKSGGSKLFQMYDVVETSYHFLANQIVLHLCDDPGAGRSGHPHLQSGGALQINVKKFQIDYYPYHLARDNRKHWPRYQASSIPHTMWQENSLHQFKTKFLDLIDRQQMQKTPLTRRNNVSPKEEQETTSPKLEQEHRRQSSDGSKSTEEARRAFLMGDRKEARKRIDAQLSKLMTSCAVLRIDDFTLYKVTTGGRKQQLKEFVCGDRDHMSLPKDASIVHAEFIYYYYPNDIPFPLPPPKFYVQLNPIQVVFDVDSCLWLNSFGLNLYQSLMASKPEMPATDLTYIDVKIEAILPRINFESAVEHPNQRDRPKSLSVQVTRATVTNVRSLEQSSRADLAKCVDSFHMGSLFFGSDFPSHQDDFYIVTQKFLDHISAKDNVRQTPQHLEAVMNQQQFTRELFWTEAKDVWSINLDPVWADFVGIRAAPKPVPFLDALPVTVWLHSHMDPNSTIDRPVDTTDSTAVKNADIHALVHVSSLVSVQLDHYQYLFLLRLAEDVAEMATYLSIDSNRVLKVESSGSIVMGAILPQLEVTFVMPSQTPGKESSGDGDVESFVPDSSSLADDLLVGSNATVWQNSTLSITQMDVKRISNGTHLEAEEEEDEESQKVPNSSHSMDFSLPQQQQQKSSRPPSEITFPNNFNSGLLSMRKGFTNLMSSIDSALKASPDDAISDTISIQSDASSDSESYVLINKNIEQQQQDVLVGTDLMFLVNEFVYETQQNNVEMASEVIEEDNTVTTTSDRSMTSSCRRKDLVSVSTFKLNKVEFMQQSVGYSSAIKIQVGSLSNDECSSIPWDEFQSKFSTRARVWTDNPSNVSTTPRVKLRLDHTLRSPMASRALHTIDFTDRANMNETFRDLVTVRVQNVALDLNMSTVTGLADLAEDEHLPSPIEMEIVVDDVRIHLNEDRPPVNITSPGAVPIDLNVSALFITRSPDGTFNISPKKVDVRKDQVQKQVVRDEANRENDELRRRLQTFERVSEENRVLRKAREENDLLKAYLKTAQDECSRLLDEKNRLLDELKKLQQLSSSFSAGSSDRGKR